MMNKVVSCVLALSTTISGVRLACKDHVCLSWKIKDDSLVLTCRVDGRRFAVTFFDPSNYECAHCFRSNCKLVKKHISIQIEESTNLTNSITLKVDRTELQSDGWWTCAYGENNANASVEVTINNVLHSKKEGVPTTDCSLLMVLYAMTGFATVFLFFRLICWIVSVIYSCCSKNDINDIEKKVFKKTIVILNYLTSRCNKNCAVSNFAVKEVTIFLLVIVVTSLAFIIGMTESNPCQDHNGRIAFAVVGSVVGCVCYLLIVARDTDEYDQVKTEGPTLGTPQGAAGVSPQGSTLAPPTVVITVPEQDESLNFDETAVRRPLNPNVNQP